MLVSNVDSGERLAMATWVWAARWNTLSTWYSFRARAISPGSQMSPWTASTRPASPSMARVEAAGSSRLIATTRAPCSSSALIVQAPSKPWPPVTRTDEPLMSPACTPRLRSTPQLPRRPAGGPQVIEHDRVLVGVHAVPEAVVAVGAQGAGRGQTRERLALEHAVCLQHVE